MNPADYQTNALYYQSDREIIERCLKIARQAKGLVEPNPAVGCVITRDGKITAEGYHREYGGTHAEIEALTSAGERARGATLYVSLEPCSKWGKTPPCSDAIIAAGIKKVVFGARDPKQNGAEALRKAGLKVIGGILEEQCRALNPLFFKSNQTDRPYVLSKWAITADGRIITPPGRTQWISSEESRMLVHRWRGAVDAICAGIGTVLADDPLLTCRAGLANPLRVVLDTDARTPLDSRLVKTIDEAPILIITAPDAPDERVKKLRKRGCEILFAPRTGKGLDMKVAFELLLKDKEARTMLLEGGSRIHDTAIREGLTDELRMFIAPVAFENPADPPVEKWAMEAAANAVRKVDTIYHRVGMDLLLRSSPETNPTR